MEGFRSILREIKPLQQLKWKVDFLLWKRRIRKHAKASDELYDAHKTYWVETDRIDKSIIPSHISSGPSQHSSVMEELGRIEKGNWDLDTLSFESLDVYQAFYQHLVGNKPWSDTQLYQRISSDIENGKTRWGCKKQSDLDERLNGFDIIYEEITKYGYRSQSDLSPSGPYGDNDEIIVHIGRNGDYLFAEGRHRLSMAKIAGVKKVPVKVAKRHSTWAQLRQEILAYAREHHGGHIYHALSHPDLQDIPAGHGHTRMEMMEPHIPQSGGRLLDIGANWGYFTNAFEDLGFDCTAVEMLPKESYFLRKLRNANNHHFKIIECAFSDMEIKADYDVVLALNIFHHSLKEKEGHASLCAFLNRLNTKIMFFQPHKQDEYQMQGAYRNYSESEFVQFVQQLAGLPKTTMLGKDTDGRSLYLLEK